MQPWTLENKDKADAALYLVETLVNKYGMQLVLEALIFHNQNAIAGANMFGVADDCFILLETNLKKTLADYKENNAEFRRA